MKPIPGIPTAYQAMEQPSPTNPPTNPARTPLFQSRPRMRQPQTAPATMAGTKVSSSSGHHQNTNTRMK